MSPALYLLSATAVPEFDDESECVLVDRGFEGAPREIIDPEQIAFLSTAVAARKHSEAVSLAISQWFTELGAENVSLELIATEPLEMSENQRHRLALLDPGAWSINTAFVAFKRDSPAAQQEARYLVLNSALLSD